VPVKKINEPLISLIMQSGENIYCKGAGPFVREINELRKENASLSKEISRLQEILDKKETNEIKAVESKLNELRKKFVENNKRIIELKNKL
jgi:predicted  nucleic acid-binding Zn-ribbon protein